LISDSNTTFVICLELVTPQTQAASLAACCPSVTHTQSETRGRFNQQLVTYDLIKGNQDTIARIQSGKSIAFCFGKSTQMVVAPPAELLSHPYVHHQLRSLTPSRVVNKRQTVMHAP
jgi:hypothetical protein